MSKLIIPEGTKWPARVCPSRDITFVTSATSDNIYNP